MIYFNNRKLFLFITFWILYLKNKTYFGRWEFKNIYKLMYTECIHRRILLEFDSENSNVNGKMKFNYSSHEIKENEENADRENIYQIINETMEKFDTWKYASSERNANNEYVDLKKNKTISKLYDKFSILEIKNKIFKKIMNYLNKKYKQIYYKQKIKEIFHKVMKDKKKKIYSLPKGLRYAAIGIVMIISFILILKVLYLSKSAFGVTTIPLSIATLLYGKCVVTTINNPAVFIFITVTIIILFILLMFLLYKIFIQNKYEDDLYDEELE
ncbi:putative exported protein [Plasmodium reichenowi]|uniref:Putative exported protein n=1 Tax=Plasmodium reichenowi TaxID=5854 RepID=A0A151L653_PLARE|nr:putative exported protein [Plasmodium reichenowi]KYN94419.1 putative exported protein [Plasmodium reichenowi]